MKKCNQKNLRTVEIIELESTPKIKRVRFNGVIYRRYPQAKNFSDRNYYRCSIGDKRRGFGALHRDIWKFYHGQEIPEGFHIHHKDGNPENNDISNLEALSPTEHRKHHAPTVKQRQAIAYVKSTKYLFEKARQQAIDWHRSPEGRNWHSEHGKRIYAKRIPIIKICEYCKNNYSTKQLQKTERFCSNKCKSAWRRAQRLDNENRVCEYCEKTFSVNKYDKQKFCSLSCAAKHRWVVHKSRASGKSSFPLSTGFITFAETQSSP